ncbi:hypothetical protein ACQY0O_006160 [Thecaphora frezii]
MLSTALLALVAVPAALCSPVLPFEQRDAADLPSFGLFSKRIVWNPQITSPTAKNVWIAGAKQTVKWDPSDKPASSLDYGSILLGYQPKDGSGGLNLEWTLAANTSLVAGQKTVKLPASLPYRQDYIVVVMGDSGNKSPHFTIQPPNHVA